MIIFGLSLQTSGIIKYQQQLQNIGTSVEKERSYERGVKMKRFISLVLCFMLVFTMFQPAFAEDSIITWTGNAGDGLWHTADNWTPERVPGSGDTAVIPESQTVTVTADTTATLDCSGEVLVEAGAHLTLTGTSYLRDGMLGGDGNITITGNGSKLHWSNGDIEGEGTFTIDPDIQLVIETDYIEDFGSYVSAVIELPLVNNGQIMVNRGYLYLVGGSEGSGTFTISDGAYLVFEEGDYNIGGNFVNEGYVYIWDASVHFGAGYRQESTGRTVLDFFGSEPGNYCKLDVGGLAELDGILEITTWEYVPGDFPSPGDTFEIMTYASRTGQFSEIISDPVKLDFDPTYGDTSLTLLTLKEDNTPPHLTSTIPAHGATMPDDADIDSLTLVFDEPVWGFSSDTEENLLSIYEAGTDHLVFERELSPYDKRGEISGNGQDTITISIPSRTFQLGKSYYIFIDEGAFVDVVGNEFAGISDSSAWNFTVQGDTQPPTVPANLHSTSNTSSAVTLQWDPASDDHGPISYQIYGKKAGDEEFVLISTTTDTTYTVIQLDGTLPEYISPETAYTFVVYAMDGGGNVSAQSNEVTVTTNQSPNLNWVKRSIETFIPSGGFPFEWIFYYDTCYGAGKYVAVGTYGTILTSAGIESPWEFEYGADSFDPSLKAITYGSDMFVAVGGNSVYTKTSTGEWNKVYSGYGSVVLEDVACGKKKDGSGDIFVAVGENMIWWSENGIDWQPCLSKPYTSTDFVFCGVAADEEGNFVAVGYKEIPYSGNNTPLIWKSGNGKNWLLALDSGGNGQLTGLAYGSGAFVAGGGSVPEALISTDKGNGWGKSSVLSGGLTKIAYGDGLFVATGGTKIYISDNGGYTWTRSGQEFENMLVSVNYCNESFVLTDTEGNIFQTVEGGGGPIPTSPSEPQDFTATPGDGQVALSWREPDSNGGSAITHYEVSSDNGATWVMVSTGTSHTFTGLTNGTEYTFKVRAVNGIGPGAQASATVTPAVPEFAGGSGTKEDPYLVANADQLNNVRNHLDKHFLLIDDIDLSGYNSGEGWEPIGSKTNNFTGSFNGDGHTISNLYIYLEGQWNARIPVGLFRYTGEGSEILNLTLENTNVTGCYYAGGLVGYNSGNITNVHVNGNITGEWDTGGLTGINNGTITNSAFTGCVTGTDTIEYGEWTGGLAGYNLGTITGCWANATVVSEDNFIGGLVGENNKGTITESYSCGAVTGVNSVGGLVGNNSDEGIITACYSTGTVNGDREVGGLVGASSGEITACYSAGAVNGNWEVGGLVGLNYGTIATSFAVGEVKGTTWTGGLVGRNSETTGTDCYWNTETSGQNKSACGKGMAAAKMKEQATYVGWDFDGVWDMNGINNNGYPFLRWQRFDVVPTAPTAPQDFTATPGDGQVVLSWTAPENDGGSAISHYEVSSDNGATWVTASTGTSHTFTGLTNGTEYTFKVRAVNGIGPGAQASATATPIAPPAWPEFAGGSGTEENPYLISTVDHFNKVHNYLDKHFRLIANLDLSVYGTAPGWEPIGTSDTPFTGTFDGNGHIISNLFVDRIANSDIGLFGSVGVSGKILNLGLVDIDVRGEYDVGGLVGENNGQITDSYAIGTVTGYMGVGGLVGNNNGAIDASWAEGTVKERVKSYFFGGLVGENANDGTITNCHANVTVNSPKSVDAGGLVGSNNGSITGSYAVGEVKGFSAVGGLVGGNSGYIEKSYSTGTVAGKLAGGLVGSNIGSINQSYAGGNVSGLEMIGGLVGNNNGSISNSYAAGNVSGISGSNYIGGLVGYNFNSVTNSYSTGAVSGGSNVGGLVGIDESYSTVTYSYWDMDTSQQTSSHGGTGKSTAEMKQQGTYEEWDFDTIWNINGSDNNGYPFLRWQIPSAVIPTVPQNFTAIPGDGQVALSWTSPENDGGAAISHYEVSSDNGSTWVTVSTGTSHTFTGLTNGIEYTFKVRAVNAIGPGAQASATATPIAPPAPTYTVTVTNGTGGGEYTEGATVTITANSAPDGQQFKQWQVISGGITLANPTEAITSFLMPANAVEVVATYEAIPTVPTAPQNFTATPGYGQVALSWTAPENNGSAAISHYEVSSDNGITWVMVSTGTSHTFTDLTNGTEYTFKVRAVNSAGPGAQASVTATPIAPPVPTYTVIVTNGTGSGEYSQGTTVVITANPASDGQQFKEWQVISGGITLENPKASGTSFEMPANYVEVVAIYEEIPVITYTVTINGSYAATTGAGSYAQGETVTIHAGSRTNYSFNGWSSSEDVTFANLNSPTTTFIMPARNVNITANWTYIDSEGSGNGGESGGNGGEDGEESGESDGEDSGDDPSGSSGDSTPSTPGTSEPPAYNADVKTGKDTEMVVPVTVDKDAGIASVTMDSDSLAQGGVNITIPSIPDIDAYSVNIPVQDLSAIDAEDTVSFHTETGSITIPSNMLADISVPDGDMAQIMIGQGDKSNLPDDIRDTIGDRPLVQLTLSIDSKQTDWNNPDAPVTVSIPYTPTAEELENPESIVVWYIDGSGNVVSVPNGRYDPETGTVTFTTTHFSYYAVGFKPVSFKDVPKDAWYAKAVSFIAAREITLGTGGGNFSPEAKLTRGQFIVMMMRAYGIAPDENPKDNFKDAGNTWYTGYLAAAKRLGISAGVGDNLFAPENAITRQEMFTLLYNGLKVIGKLPRGNSGKTLSDFSDAGDIAPWAMDAMKLLVETGMVSGSGNKLSPKDTTTRAQMAQVFYNLLSK